MATANPTGTRGRRTVRPSGDDREIAILATAEKLLEQRPFAEISVDDLAKGAGLSRPTFYFYFPSKDAVLLTLFERVMTEADAAFDGLIEKLRTDREGTTRTVINVFFETFHSRPGVALACNAVGQTNPEIRQVWTTFMQKWVDTVADLIEAERARGAAPVTLPARDLSTALNLMNQRVFFASYADEQPSVPAATVLDTLVHIWISSIWGQSG